MTVERGNDNLNAEDLLPPTDLRARSSHTFETHSSDKHCSATANLYPPLSILLEDYESKITLWMTQISEDLHHHQKVLATVGNLQTVFDRLEKACLAILCRQENKEVLQDTLMQLRKFQGHDTRVMSATDLLVALSTDLEQDLRERFRGLRLRRTLDISAKAIAECVNTSSASSRALDVLHEERSNGRRTFERLAGRLTMAFSID